jgi:hypothetical protein
LLYYRCVYVHFLGKTFTEPFSTNGYGIIAYLAVVLQYEYYVTGTEAKASPSKYPTISNNKMKDGQSSAAESEADAMLLLQLPMVMMMPMMNRTSLGLDTQRVSNIMERKINLYGISLLASQTASVYTIQHGFNL